MALRSDEETSLPTHAMTVVRYVQQPCDTATNYEYRYVLVGFRLNVASLEHQRCVLSAVGPSICVQHDRDTPKSMTMCTTSTSCLKSSRPWPPSDYLAAVGQSMLQPKQVQPPYMSSLPHLTEQQWLRPQNLMMETITASDMLLQQRQSITCLAPSQEPP